MKRMQRYLTVEVIEIFSEYYIKLNRYRFRLLTSNILSVDDSDGCVS